MGVDVMRGQLCVNQGAFRTSGVGWAYGLEYIAANLQSPTVVLHWPSVAELIFELRRGDYDVVGLTFTFQLVPRMAETVALIRRHAPRARVVLGGYGTADDACHGLADDVCQGEGIAYMRGLLGEREGAPVEHPTIVYSNQLLSLPIRAGRKAVICTGLGCVNGCDFCASSHFFRRRYQALVGDGREMFEIMDGIHRRTGVDEFMVLDENFLADRERATQLADCCDRAGRHFEFFTFASVKALSGYTADELCRIGISSVWVGFEAKRSGYDKLHGEELCSLSERLQHHGILVCGSMIIGFDYQTPAIIREELAGYLEAEPTYLQCLIYGPTPGTALHEQMEREGRWLGGPPGKGGVPHGQCDGYRLGFVHPQISAQQMARLQQECLQRDLLHGGFSIYRAIETWMRGYRNLRASPQAFLRARAELFARKLRACRPLLWVGVQHAPSERSRRRMEALRRDLVAEFGPLTARETALERLLLPAAARWTDFKLRHDLLQQPRLIRHAYRC